MRRKKQHFHVGDRVRVRVSGWIGTVVRTHNRRGVMFQSGGFQDVIVAWKNGTECRVSQAKQNLERLQEKEA